MDNCVIMLHDENMIDIGKRELKIVNIILLHTK